MRIDGDDWREPPAWATCTFDDGDLSRYWTVIGEIRSVDEEPIPI